MTVFRGGFKPEISSGLMNLNSVKQMLFCIAQEESAARELDAYSILGISNILGDAGYEIEYEYNSVYEELEATRKRHNKLRAALAFYVESGGFVDMSAIAKILADDEKEAPDAN